MKRDGLIFFAVPVVILLVVIGLSVMFGPGPRDAIAPGGSRAVTESKSKATDEERAYISAVGGYLKTVNESDGRVALAMAGVSSATTTLSDIAVAIRRARSEQGSAHAMAATTATPPYFADMTSEIEEVNRLHESAYRELLDYWRDGNEVHIVSCNATLKRAVLATNAAIDHMNVKMKGINER